MILYHYIKHPHSRQTHNSKILKYTRNWPFDYKKYAVFRGQTPDHFKLNSCQAGRFFALIEVNGDLMPCCVPRPDYKPVNVFASAHSKHFSDGF